MSRGHGTVQREILAGVDALPNGQLLLVGDGGWPYRRAAHRLAEEGHVALELVSVFGKRRLGVRRLNPLEQVRRGRDQRYR